MGWAWRSSTGLGVPRIEPVLDVDDTLAVLDGSFVTVDGSPMEPPTKPAAQVSLTRVTAYLSEHLLLLLVPLGNGRGPLPPGLDQPGRRARDAAEQGQDHQ